MRMMTVCAVLALLAAPAVSQSCNLAVTGSLMPGDTLSIQVTDSIPNAPTLLAVGETLGSTNFNFGPLGGFTIDLAEPFIILPLGLTDANGDTGIAFSVPANAPTPPSLPSLTLHLQAVTIDLGFGITMPPMVPPMPSVLNTCVSNLVTFTL